MNMEEFQNGNFRRFIEEIVGNINDEYDLDNEEIEKLEIINI